MAYGLKQAQFLLARTGGDGLGTPIGAAASFSTLAGNVCIPVGGPTAGFVRFCQARAGMKLAYSRDNQARKPFVCHADVKGLCGGCGRLAKRGGAIERASGPFENVVRRKKMRGPIHCQLETRSRLRLP